MASTLVDVVGSRAASSDEVAFEFAGGRVGLRELDARARAVAARLVERDLGGQRVAILLPVGSSYVTAFLGCLYAGAVAVPLPGGKFGAWHRAVLDDAGPAAAFADSPRLRNALRQLDIPVLSTVDVGRAGGSRPEIGADTLAVLQYPPGDTAHGVMVNHGNLVAACAQLGDGGAVVSWLPSQHGAGLVAGVLAPLYSGRRGVLVDERTVLDRPATWLRLISDHGATLSVGPDFAYRRCAEEVTDDELAGIDLSTWEHALVGVESEVDAETLERFAARMAPFGFRRTALHPCYGIPEATSLITAGPAGEVTAFDQDTLAPGRLAKPSPVGAPVVDRGIPLGDNDIVIVDPLTRTRCPDGSLGEVWVSGPAVAVGYLGRPDLSERTFCARLHGSRENYLRTGDIGFIRDGGLHITEPAGSGGRPMLAIAMAA